MLENTLTAFRHFATAVEAGDSGIFFSDFSPREQAEFCYGIGDYELVDFEAELFPKFSIFDWKGETDHHYYFQDWRSDKSEVRSEKCEWLELPVDSELFSFSDRPGKAWQEKVAQVIKYQERGDAWVVNLAHDYVSGPFTDMASFKRELLRLFYRFLQLPNSHSAGIVFTSEQIFCSFSPELFVRQSDGQILTSPIKGTGTVEYLNTSQKERSELDMITDLLRNDLGQICDTVSVLNERFLVAEKNFYSARSLIRGQFDGALTPADYQRLLPAGSISGAPKARVVEIIESLEDFSREFYTGTMGVQLSPTDSVWNILIRTIFVDATSKHWSFPVGVGITAESDPAAEWQETWQKAQLLTDLAR